MDHVSVVRQVYEAMAAKDLDALFRLLDPEVVVTQDPALPWGGRHEGHGGFAPFGLTLTNTITSVVSHDALFVADGDVIQVGRTRVWDGGGAGRRQRPSPPPRPGPVYTLREPPPERREA